MDYAPVAFISAFTGQRVNTILQQVSGIYQNARRRVPTGVLNDVINDAVNDLQPPMQGGRRLRIYYATQGGVQPPTFILFVNDPDLLNFSYERYLENFFRKTMDFSGTPIRFQLRERKKDGKQ